MAAVSNMNSSHNLVTTAPTFVVIQILLSTNGERTVKGVKGDISYIEESG